MAMINHDNNWDELELFRIDSENDIVKARQIIRHFAKEAGLGLVDQTRITTAASELFRNMYQYANGGEVKVEKGLYHEKTSFIITCSDKGDGIDDLELAMKDGYSSGSGMGLGLPGAKRLVDDFEIESNKGVGTRIRIIKWI